MPSTILIKRGTSDPTAAQVTNSGELAANTSTPKLFIKTANDSSTAPVWVGATIESSPGDWTSATKLATQSAINTTFMPKSGGAFTGDVTLNAQSDLRFADSDSSNWVAFQAPATVASNVTWTLPSGDGSAGTLLSTNGSGTLSWASSVSATTATTTSDNTNTTRYLVFSSSAQSGATLYVDDTTTALSYNPSTAEITIAGDVNVNGGDLKTSAATASVFDANATTLTVGAAATSLTIGYNSTATSTTNISTGAVATATTKTINIGTGGAAGSTTDINLGSSNGGTVTVNKDLVVSGNLTINGTTTTVNSTTLTIDDKNIVLGNDNTLDTAADGGGITLKGGSDKTFNWVDATDAWTSSEHMNLLTGKSYYINGTSVLSSSTLGAGVTVSSLAQVGTIATGTWTATDIGLLHGGTNASLSAIQGGVVYSTASAMDITSAGSSGQLLQSNGTSAPSWILTSSITAGAASSVTLTADNSANTRYMVFSNGTGTGRSLYADETTGPITYVPSTNTLTVNNVNSNSGSAAVLKGTNNHSSTLTLTGNASANATSALLNTSTFNLGGNGAGGNTYLAFTENLGGYGFYFSPNALSGDGFASLPAASGTMVVYGNSGNTNQIQTLGTISTGTWQATDVGLLHGGTSASLTAVNGGIVYSTASAMAITSAGTSGHVLQSNGANPPSWVSSVATATVATTVTLTATNSTNATHYLTFVDAATGNEEVRTDTALYYNPSTNVLTAGTVEAIIDGGSY